MPVLGTLKGQVDGIGILGEELEWAKVSILVQSRQARKEGRIQTHICLILEISQEPMKQTLLPGGIGDKAITSLLELRVRLRCVPSRNPREEC